MVEILFKLNFLNTLIFKNTSLSLDFARMKFNGDVEVVDNFDSKPNGSVESFDGTDGRGFESSNRLP